MTGVVFDIKEFAVYDGPGIRTTVFLKGCPLRCSWCHNPEGLSPLPQLMVSTASCIHCGACETVCRHREKCVSCGECVASCALGLRKISGMEMEASALAGRLMKGQSIFQSSGGGVTFSGGEPLMQWDFVEETMRALPGIHTAVETSGFTSDEVFERVMRSVNLVMMDVKLTDPKKHLKYTGVRNAPILKHLCMLTAGDTPFIIRMPLIPGVSDDPSHARNVARLLVGAKKLIRVEMLPYHKTAGAKYGMLGMSYSPDFPTDQPVQAITAPFEEAGIPVLVL